MKHLVVLRLSAMGDVAMVVPVLRALLDQYPSLKITVVTKSFFKPIFKSLPVTVLAVDTKKRHKGLLGIYKLAQEIKDCKPSHIVDLHQVLRTKLLRVFLPFKSAALNKNRKAKKAFLAKEIKELPSVFGLYAAVFSELGYPINLDNPSFPTAPIIENSHVDQTKKWVGIAPFAQYESKSYPIDKMKILVAEIAKRPVEVLLFGGPDEVDKLDFLRNGNPTVHNLSQYRLGLDKELDYIANLACMVSMDSGNGHLAAMYGIPVLTMWGVTHPSAGFTPFNQVKAHSFLPDLDKYPAIPTSIYGNKYPAGYIDAMKTIRIESVLHQLELLI